MSAAQCKDTPMEDPTGLLVALMFVTIVTMGIVNLLTFLSERIRIAGWPREHPLQLAWLVIVLLVSFDIFWQCIEILAIEDWGFIGFLFMVAGASMLFFATTVLPVLDGPDDDAIQAETQRASRLFFILLAGFFLWFLTLGFLFDAKSLPDTLLTAAALITVSVMAAAPSPRVNLAGTIAAGGQVVLLLASSALL
jgi:hypothetical protein